jgi:hypothetical protein
VHRRKAAVRQRDDSSSSRFEAELARLGIQDECPLCFFDMPSRAPDDAPGVEAGLRTPRCGACGARADVRLWEIQVLRPGRTDKGENKDKEGE